MPRHSREQSGTGIYHVMLRGVNRQSIFEDEEDCVRFISLLKKLIERFDDAGKPLPALCVLYAYCLMDNHVHLLVKKQSESISTVIKRLAVSYAYYFNRKYSHNGHLFQDRFKRIKRQELLEQISAPLEMFDDPLDKNEDTAVFRSVSDSEARELLRQSCGHSNIFEIQTLPRKDRNEILEAALINGVGVRQLARLTGVSYGIIQRINEKVGQRTVP